MALLHRKMLLVAGAERIFYFYCAFQPDLNTIRPCDRIITAPIFGPVLRSGWCVARLTASQITISEKAGQTDETAYQLL
ncbi:hypothetical protein [Loktanella sp. SALINAS62]|uniref:hypothetical protein n=1 Tax=Loktanella sp. SALINAS62 TaxID=2706124 RepID=UPI001B8B93F1|nr:hypothetical protein [Loktanella sp. SALINAS62]MBS1300919.1 hypothetical protein [Loktanella sp. SALINAS62]